MKTAIMCGPLSHLFDDPESKVDARKVCDQCPSLEWCTSVVVDVRPIEMVMAGKWFDHRGRPHTIPDRPQERMAEARQMNEEQFEADMNRLLYGEPGPIDYHEVWTIGISCQNAMKRIGDRCDDPVCRETYSQQRKERNRRGKDRRKKAA